MIVFIQTVYYKIKGGVYVPDTPPEENKCRCLKRKRFRFGCLLRSAVMRFRPAPSLPLPWTKSRSLSRWAVAPLEGAAALLFRPRCRRAVRAVGKEAVSWRAAARPALRPCAVRVPAGWPCSAWRPALPAARTVSRAARRLPGWDGSARLGGAPMALTEVAPVPGGSRLDTSLNVSLSQPQCGCFPHREITFYSKRC